MKNVNCTKTSKILTKLIIEEKTLCTIDLKDGGNCNSSGVIYAPRCKQHDLICVGHTGEKLRDRFSKHCYDIKYRPDNSELARHFHEG